jgi:hypothetical protein
MELIKLFTWIWYGGEPFLTLSKTKLLLHKQKIVNLVSHAFLCCILLLSLQKD